jgi:hypothetical protein
MGCVRLFLLFLGLSSLEYVCNVFCRFLKSTRFNHVVRGERLLGSFSVYVMCIYVLMLVSSYL